MLYVIDDVVFYDQRIIIPKPLQPLTLNLIHESHFVVKKCKSRARKLVYWPSMNADVDRIVKNCELCIKYQNNQQRKPMISHTVLNERFLEVGINIMTFQAKDYLVIVDYYSKYPELQCLSDKTASTIIEQCKSVFARHGIPVEIVSDNMPFQSNEFIAFAKAWGIKTTTSSPIHSQTNGQTERSVQTLKKILKSLRRKHRSLFSSFRIS